MRVLVCGGRDYADFERVTKVLDEAHEMAGIECVIHGAARGADSLAGRWAVMRGIPVMEFPADWSQHGKAAGPIRNALMLKEGKPTLVIAFPGGRGTADMTGRAKAEGIPVVLG